MSLLKEATTCARSHEAWRRVLECFSATARSRHLSRAPVPQTAAWPFPLGWALGEDAESQVMGEVEAGVAPSTGDAMQGG